MMTIKEIQRYKRLFRDHTRRGAELLDATPSAKGWRKKIDVDQLAMSSGKACVLGQTYGSFYLGLLRIGRRLGYAWRFGFSLNLDENVPNESAQQLWSMLTEAWIARLRS